MSLMRRGRTSWPLETVWNPETVDDMFRDMLRNFFTGEGVMERALESGHQVMRVEEFIDGDTCVIRAELPGIDPDKDVDVSVVDGVLHLRAERREEHEEKRPDGFRSEFHYGRLTRSVVLPEGASASDVKATYEDGILEIRVPAPRPATASEPTKIAVSRA